MKINILLIVAFFTGCTTKQETQKKKPQNESGDAVGRVVGAPAECPTGYVRWTPSAPRPTQCASAAIIVNLHDDDYGLYLNLFAKEDAEINENGLSVDGTVNHSWITWFGETKYGRPSAGSPYEFSDTPESDIKINLGKIFPMPEDPKVFYPYGSITYLKVPKETGDIFEAKMEYVSGDDVTYQAEVKAITDVTCFGDPENCELD